MDHPHIAKIFELFQDEEHYYLVHEYYEVMRKTTLLFSLQKGACEAVASPTRLK